LEYRTTKDGLLEVSAIGLGSYALAGVYGRKDPETFKEVVFRALDLGVTFFDTAPVYGNAEEIVAEVLRGVRKDVVISTKVAAGLGSELSCSYETVVASCEQSLGRLGTDYIDLLQIHFDDGKTAPEEVVRAFENLKSEGKIRAYGIGHVSPERAFEYASEGRLSTVMGELNGVSRSYYKKMLPIVRSSGAGYIGFSLTARGILTGKLAGREDLSQDDIRRMDAVFAGERIKSAIKIRDSFAAAGKDIGATPVQVAIRWALGQEGVLTGLIGPSSVEHLEENLGAADLEIPGSLMTELGSILDNEDRRMAVVLREEIGGMLGGPLSGPSAATDLIYVIEGVAELELAPEQDLIGHMKMVLKAVKTPEGDVEALEAVRRVLLGYVKS
jgi:aryl-alcohol dehydrogenase-like predicted oxidoreductase